MEYKQAIIVRTDLNMKRGKIASQAAHASVTAAFKTLKEKPKIFEEWFPFMKKVVLKIGSKEEMVKLRNKAKRMGMVAELIKDAGRTQVPPGSITALAIGPDEEEKVDKVTKELKLL